MKISKVNHARVGVVSQEEKSEGVLYKSPAEEGMGKQNIQEKVEELSKNANKLYQLFNNQSTGMDDSLKSVYNETKIYLKILTNELLKIGENNSLSEEQIIDKQLSFLKELPQKCIFCKNKEEKKTLDKIEINWKQSDAQKVMQDLVLGCLKKSMHQTVYYNGCEVYLPDVIEKLGIALFSGANYSTNLQEIPQNEVKAFLKALNKDGLTDKHMAGIVRSIENQNVRVQCVQVDGESCLQLSSAANEKKKYLFDFLKEYAINTNEGRDQMIIHFRQLILLYFCGEKVYQLSLGKDAHMGVKSFGIFLPDEDNSFCRKAEDLYLINKANNTKRNEKDKNEKKKKKAEYKKNLAKMGQELHRTIAVRYQESEKFLTSIEKDEVFEADIYWLHYIENQAEHFLAKPRILDSQKLSQSYLCKKTFLEWLSYIGMKYVDMGKAVYHFAMPQGNDFDSATRFGEVLPQYKEGITSFDYERVKAEESLNMNLFSAISFASENYDHASRTDEQRNIDIFGLLDRDNIQIRDDAYRQLLQFFGGKSKWKNTDIELYEGIDLVRAFGKELYRLRNMAFHYTGTWKKITDDDQESRELILEMYKEEYSQVGSIIRKKYYSNNALMFYKRNDIDRLIMELYAHPVQRPAQIPSFGRILSKTGIKEFKFIRESYWGKLWGRGSDPRETGEKFENAFLFIMKEIYYNAFLQLSDSELKERFVSALDQQEKQPVRANGYKLCDHVNNQNALDNLLDRIDDLDSKDELSFGELCQAIMTDYDIQNQNMKKSPSGENKAQEKQIYKHFRTLLDLGIRQAFSTWLLEDENKERFDFLRSPAWKENWAEDTSEQAFCDGPNLYVYNDILEKGENKDSELFSWYTLAHFLNQSELNHLIGSLKNYSVFLKDIDRRAKSTGSRVDEKWTSEQTKRFDGILEMLDFCKLFCEQTTNQLEDYFANEEEYDKYLSHYVAWEKENKPSLRSFCEQDIKIKIINDQKGKEDEQHQKIGIYYDEIHPIVNRNVIRSKMYGNEKLLTACLEENPITTVEIKNWYQSGMNLMGKAQTGTKNSNHNVFKTGYCENKLEQQNLRDYQNDKNRIELVDLVSYTELVNDLMSQLRNWCYMRERDHMYCQLGIHYIGLHYGDEKVRLPWLDQLEGENIHIESGAVLQQIVSMNTYGLPIYKYDENLGASLVEGSEKQSGKKKYNAFINNYCRGDKDIYERGLCFFENLDERDEITKFRNQIDHFNYDVKLNRSILSLYGEMFDRFLRYDSKLQKSVPVILKNILLDHFIIADLTFVTDTERIDTKKNTRRTMVTIRLRENREDSQENSLRSDVLTYQLNRGNKEGNHDKVYVPARSEKFIDVVKKLLNYCC